MKTKKILIIKKKSHKGKFKDNFIKNQGLSEPAKKLRAAIEKVLKSKKLLTTDADDDAFQREIGSRQFNLSNTFGKLKDKSIG